MEKETYLKNWTKSSYIKTGNGALNNLKVQKAGSAYKFFYQWKFSVY